MPLIIPKNLPAYDELQQENVFVMHQERAMSQHIRPLRILILNLMPTKIVTETQLARLLANSPLQVQVTFLQTATHSTTHTAPEHMKAFYKTFDEIRNERFDGMIITGAPIEDLDYEAVDYWDELCRIMDYTKENVYSTIHLCWGALAGLYYHFGIPKVHLDKKMFGVFEHRVTRPSNPLVRGFDEVFYAPHSRWAGLDRAAIDACPDLRILAESDVAGPMLLSTESGRQIFVIGHPEYDKYTLDKEYKRDVKAGKPITKRAWRQMEAAGVEKIEVAPETPLGLFLAEDLVDNATGEILAEAADEITAGLFDACREAGITTISARHTRGTDTSSSIRDTLVQDKTPTMEKAQEEIYRRLRPSSPPTPEIAASFFDNLFRNGDYYDLSPLGRYKLNQRLNKTDHADLRTLADDDILDAIKVLVQLKDSHGPADDIDHLGNRRVRLVGELVENQYRIGLVRMERAIKERMSIQEVATLMPHDLINPKPVAAVLKEFFGTSQLSQFMDQTNSLSEVTHKRRLSALGPGGLTRERAGFEVRDVHVSHYGRICPIETPEGPNIGLIVSLTTYAKVNDYGFIETPYRVIRDGYMTDEFVHLDASRETGHVIAQANAAVDADRRLVDDYVTARVGDDVLMAAREEITLMDISPSQMVSISAALIPFLEHDDANRALMGSNMQRQAVPLLRSERPLVGTGMEVDVATPARASSRKAPAWSTMPTPTASSWPTTIPRCTPTWAACAPTIC